MVRDLEHSKLTNNIKLLKQEFNLCMAINHNIKEDLSEAIKLKDLVQIYYLSDMLKDNKKKIHYISEKLRTKKDECRKHQKEQKFYEQRMYILTDNYLKTLQVGVQSLHAEVEYSNQYGNTSDYYQWSRKDKTVIILNGGNYPDLIDNYQFLLDNNIRCAYFKEPDHNDNITAIAFLMDERVWNTEKYPDFDGFNNLIYQCFAKPQMKENWAKRIFNTSVEEADRIIKLRTFIFNKRLAQ